MDSEKCLSRDGKGSMYEDPAWDPHTMVVLVGGRFLKREVPLYGTDPSEVRCLSLEGYLASKKRSPTPLRPP